MQTTGMLCAEVLMGDVNLCRHTCMCVQVHCTITCLFARNQPVAINLNSFNNFCQNFDAVRTCC